MALRKVTKYGGFRIVGTIGDVNFPEFGGGEIYELPKDQGGIFVLEYVVPPDMEFDDRNARWTIYRVHLLEGLPDWGNYKTVARTVGVKPKELKEAFESDDPLDSAWATEAWAAHYGWHELDSYPLVLDKRETEERYETEIGDGIEEEEEEEEEEETGD
jgi:hypothetical protein